jgi:two-component system, OmpR family, sensor histidine kinase QseC
MKKNGRTRWFSLQNRLLLWVLGSLLLAWSVTLFFSHDEALHEINEIFDAQLAQMGDTLLALSQTTDEDDLLDVLEKPAGHEYEIEIRIHLWVNDKAIVQSDATSQNLRALPMGFSTQEEGSARDSVWRYYAQISPDGKRHIVVGENLHERTELAEEMALQMGLPMLIGLPLVALWVSLGIRQSLLSLRRMAREIETRAPEHLVALEPPSAPTEVRPILDALNHLFSRVSEAMERERRFTGDAAHELRTPLAALATQAEVLRRARNSDERAHAALHIQQAALRASHLVNQLLTLARLDPQTTEKQWPIVHLDQLIQEACAQVGPQAFERNHELSLEKIPIACTGQVDLLLILMRNLLDNSLRYTPSGGTIHVSLRDEGDIAVLCICDDGPGIPAAQRVRALRRFQRLSGQEIEGSGLGLSIVARIVELHGGTIQLREGGLSGRDVGLCVEVHFPKARPFHTQAVSNSKT